jgi:hypothetical protein
MGNREALGRVLIKTDDSSAIVDRCLLSSYKRRKSGHISQIFDLESTRAGADGSQARAPLSHSKRP